MQETRAFSNTFPWPASSEAPPMAALPFVVRRTWRSVVAGNVGGIHNLKGSHSGTNIHRRGRFDGIAHEDVGDEDLRLIGLLFHVVVMKRDHPDHVDLVADDAFPIERLEIRITEVDCDRVVALHTGAQGEFKVAGKV